MSGAVVIPDEVVALMRSLDLIGRSGMRDADNVPTMQRPTHWVVSDDRTRVTCFYPEVFGPSMRRCLESNAQLAFNVSQAGTHECYQLKGEVSEMRASTEAEKAEAGPRLEALKALLLTYGIGSDVTARMLGALSLAVTMDVREVFVQTPGPGAGRRIAPPAE